MKITGKEKIVKKLEGHFRETSRELVKFETFEETLQYLSDSFRLNLAADFVGIILKEGENFSLKVWSGPLSITDSFPISINHCNPRLLNRSMTSEEAKSQPQCEFAKLMSREKVFTWFTFPLRSELNLFGFCIIGFFRNVKLMPEMEKFFNEFGNDIAISFLYQNEKRHKKKLQLLFDYQQTLVKETVVSNHFDGITETLCKLFSKSVILLDRFIRPISYKLYQIGEEKLEQLVELATFEIFEKVQRAAWFSHEQTFPFKVAVWPINGGGELLGYLAIDVTNEQVDDYFRLSIELARNIISVQFIKQKLVFDAKDQVKESFINKLLVEKIDDEWSIIQYANLFHWDIFQPHQVAILVLSSQMKNSSSNILELEAEKSLLWDKLKKQISINYPELLFANKEGQWILIGPVDENKKKPKVYWLSLYENIKKWSELENSDYHVYLAVGGTTKELPDYYRCYLQASKALNVVIHRFKDIGFAFFEELEAYTLLDQLKDAQAAETFIKMHLEPLLHYSEGKGMDLFVTLRKFLEQNGHIKETADELYIHRSTLLYRLDKIQNILDVDLNYFEHRFNLLLAYKLYDLYEKNS